MAFVFFQQKKMKKTIKPMDLSDKVAKIPLSALSVWGFGKVWYCCSSSAFFTH